MSVGAVLGIGFDRIPTLRWVTGGFGQVDGVTGTSLSTSLCQSLHNAYMFLCCPCMQKSDE